jgi:glycine/D-amino acid oxidase-like deaminating enzyme
LHGIPFEWLAPDEIRSRFPQFRVGDDWVGGYGARAGFLDVNLALVSMGTEARRLGVRIYEHADITQIDLSSARPTVTVADEQISADKVIVTAGAWSNTMLGELGLPLQVLRKTLFWLEVERPELYSADVLPIYIAGIPGYEFYGFPQWGKPGIKVAVHSGGDPADPENVDRVVSVDEKREIVQVADQVLRGLTGNVLEATTCLYTITPDHNFVIDRHPVNRNVVIGAGFSGHGFKFAPAIGEMLVHLAYGERETLPIFQLNRFAAVA